MSAPSPIVLKSLLTTNANGQTCTCTVFQTEVEKKISRLFSVQINKDNNYTLGFTQSKALIVTRHNGQKITHQAIGLSAYKEPDPALKLNVTTNNGFSSEEETRFLPTMQRIFDAVLNNQAILPKSPSAAEAPSTAADQPAPVDITPTSKFPRLIELKDRVVNLCGSVYKSVKFTGIIATIGLIALNVLKIVKPALITVKTIQLVPFILAALVIEAGVRYAMNRKVTAAAG